MECASAKKKKYDLVPESFDHAAGTLLQVFKYTPLRVTEKRTEQKRWGVIPTLLWGAVAKKKRGTLDQLFRVRALVRVIPLWVPGAWALHFHSCIELKDPLFCCFQLWCNFATEHGVLKTFFGSRNPGQSDLAKLHLVLSFNLFMLLYRVFYKC